MTVPASRPSLSSPLSRRGFLAFAGAGGAAAAAAYYGYSAAPAWAGTNLPADPFTLGVASGDPTPDGFVLWTRLAPDPLAADGNGGMPAEQVPLTWQVATDPDLRDVIKAGNVRATPELGHSVQSLPSSGRYAAYRAMLNDDLDLVVHVGDYTYERRNDETLADFRTNHARYKLSPDLQAAHAQFPFVVTFDDHEIENNWADGISQPDNEPSNEPARFRQLRANAFQAYYEHLPLRLPQRPNGPDMLLHRRLDYGTLATFHVLDTRQYRSDQLTEAFPGGPLHPGVNDPARTFMGDEQERWLFANMQETSARWNLVAQQTIMAQVDYDGGPGMSVNHDQWDGYAVSRNRFLSFVEQARPANPVVLTGDWHSAWVNDLRLDFTKPETPVLATELVGTSISSGCGWAAAVKAARPNNPHVKYLNPDLRGYTRITATPATLRADYRVVPSAADLSGPASTDSSWVVEDGRPGAVPAQGR